MNATAEFTQIRNDMFWKFPAGPDGTIRWSGYDDDFWWNEVSSTAPVRDRVGSVTGRIFRLDHATGLVEIITPAEQVEEPQTTFTKFDALGAVLAELSFRAVSLHFSRHDDGGAHSTVYLHSHEGLCVQGSGKTPSDALADAMSQMVSREAERVEAAAERVAA